VSETRRQAVALAQHYFRQLAVSAGMNWDGDNDTEIELMVSFIIDAAAAGPRSQLDDALERIRVLDRLRPTCVICRDATADRQTVRGPACTDCVGDLPDDEPETSFPGPGREADDEGGMSEHRYLAAPDDYSGWGDTR